MSIVGQCALFSLLIVNSVLRNDLIALNEINYENIQAVSIAQLLVFPSFIVEQIRTNQTGCLIMFFNCRKNVHDVHDNQTGRLRVAIDALVLYWLYIYCDHIYEQQKNIFQYQ